MTPKTKIRKTYKTKRFKHCSWEDLSKAQQEFYDEIIKDFKTGKIFVDEFRGTIGYYEEEIYEHLGVEYDEI